jgi:hypothetical protein
MPRYLIERTLQEDNRIPGPNDPEHDRTLFIDNNNLVGAIWIRSYVSIDRKKSYCLYDAPSPEAVRQAAIHNRLPIDRIIEVRLLDPFLF